VHNWLKEMNNIALKPLELTRGNQTLVSQVAQFIKKRRSSVITAKIKQLRMSSERSFRTICIHTRLWVQSLSPSPPQLLLFSLNTQSSIPRRRCSGIPGPQRRNLCLRSQTRRLPRAILRHPTVINQIIADRIRDDVRVQRILLTLGNDRVGGQEGAFVGCAVELRAAELEIHCWGAGAEV